MTSWQGDEEMTDFQPRALHLHTLDSLVADLASGRNIIVGEGKEYCLPDNSTRSALHWYKEQGLRKWTASVSVNDGESLVDAIQKNPAVIPALSTIPPNANGRRLTLKKLEAHRFAGLHKFGTPSLPPANYVHEFDAPVTLFEGRNGSGKTSLANALIWGLTGELLRPQRAPEKSDGDFTCWVDPVGEGDPSTHMLTPVTPMPDVADFRPTGDWVPADTWVELTFADENGSLLPPIRRTHTRTARGKPTEQCDLSPLGVDPIATRIGTVMPGLLGLIKVGSESELGKAVSELTGLSALVDLADHARRAQQKIDKDFVKSKTAERDRIDAAYNTFKEDLENEVKDRPSLTPPISIPKPSDDRSIEDSLETITRYYDDQKSSAFSSAKEILGNSFDPADSQNKADLDRNIAPALSELSQLSRLPSLARLHGLKVLSEDQISSADFAITRLLAEAQELVTLAKNPDAAARTRLYARIAAWMADHPDPERDLDECVTCRGSLIGVIDPTTGNAVKDELDQASANADLLSQTIKHWSQ